VTTENALSTREDFEAEDANDESQSQNENENLNDPAPPENSD
jgi:hypothetical protein